MEQDPCDILMGSWTPLWWKQIICPYIEDVVRSSETPDSEWCFEVIAVSKNSAMERGWELILCALHEILVSIFILWVNPQETGWPPCGFNPIYWILPLTIRQSLSCDLNTRFLEHKTPQTHFLFLVSTSFTPISPHPRRHSPLHHSNW